ncbi:MAG: NADH-quinone oxidoreductase subunit NuoH [Alphaproteobacteria bacterium]|nr:NADH-quinone oxidoreductase subunit NuoH [Alphaproteobacteria bacterium]
MKELFLDTIWPFVWPLMWIAIKILCIILPLLGAVAYLTYAERRVLAAMQLRRGPNVTGPFGLLQPIADGVKLLGKETVLPTQSNKVVFLLAPILAFFFALVAWAVIPFQAGLVLADINVGLLFLVAISSLSVYSIVFAGWSSNSKYSFLGGIRSAAQMVSYEVCTGLVLVTVLLRVGSLNLSAIVDAQRDGWFAFGLLTPMFVVYLIAMLAETNRHPFDLPEGESELVGGFHTEYSSMAFAMFFLGEYSNMILLSAISTILFWGGWLPPFEALDFIPGIFWFLGKTAASLFFFLWVRATLPRYRYDQLMRIGWKVLMPLCLVWVVVTAGYLVAFDKLPH